MMKITLLTIILAGITGCAAPSFGPSLGDTTARVLGLSSAADVTISNESGGGIVGTKYYTATTKKGESYNCAVFSNLGLSNPPSCVKKVN